MNYSDPSRAFATAIERGALKEVDGHPLSVYAFMYMGDDAQGSHLFKHKGTRRYIPPVAPVVFP